jgi:hypothetical protein
MSGKNKLYTIGRGELNFAQSTVAGAAPLAAAMFRYLGNSPDTSFSSSPTKLDHYDADHGLKVKDDSVTLQFDRTGKFTLDSMDVANVAMQFLAHASVYSQAAATAVDEPVTASPGMGFQLGTSINPMGLKNVSNVTAANTATPATTYAAGTDFVVDPVSGWVKIPDGSVIAANTGVTFTFDAAAGTRDQVISASDVTLEGALRWRSYTIKGAKYDYFMPYVNIVPDGDFVLKGDTWQQMSFTFDILDPSDGRAMLYIDGQPQLVP